MTTPNNGPGGREPLPPIKFEELADALLPFIDTLVEAWLPGGTVKNNEYFVHSFWRSEKTASLSVCVRGANKGKWADHGGEHRGNDLIQLYAAIHGLSQGHAAVQLARDHGLEDVAGVVRASAPGQAPPPRPPAPPPAPAKKAEPEGWRTMIPVPDHAPPATFKHQHRQPGDIEHTAEYRIDGHLFGYVVRFRTSDGGKETLPYTWCMSARDGACRWHWKQWDEPRPLYYPGKRKPEARTVIVVEGEKKADILQALLNAGAPNVYCVVTWPGGSKAWNKALWDWLAGCHVLLWPDCDGKREQLTKAERDACPDELARAVLEQAKPLLPAYKQVGIKAMTGIGGLLQDTHGCTVRILPIPEPGAVTDGWDCADAINTDGWDYERVLAFFGSAQPLPSSDGPAAGGGKPPNEPPGDRPADAEDGDDEFADYLAFIASQAKCNVWDLGVNRKLLIAALRKSPALKECLGFSELTDAPCTRTAWPWRPKPGPLENSDPLRFGGYLSDTYKIKAASVAALKEAIDTVADERRFHPVRDWLKGLKHDGTPRLEKWLMHVLGIDPRADPPAGRSPAEWKRHIRYMQLVSRFILLGLVARVMEPGCKFDYAPVLEGPGGIGKSTFVKVLVGEEFFSDTHFDIGQGKDGMEQFAGLWAYELSELTALRRADSEQVKQFFSSQKDRFRGAYGHYVQSHPRQLVIFCSTNKKVYLFDTTGNRRYWPFWIGQRINTEWLSRWREQLFAEALVHYQAGERFYPSPEEEEVYFVPEQNKRLAETSVQSRLYDMLTREGAPGGEGKVSATINQLTKFLTMDQLVAALGTDPGKSSSMLEGQIRAWLEAHGWEAAREKTGQRRRGYAQPAVWPPKIEDDAVESELDGEDDRPPQADLHGGDDDAPF